MYPFIRFIDKLSESGFTGFKDFQDKKTAVHIEPQEHNRFRFWAAISEIGAVRNADRKCKAKTYFAACGQNLGEYAAKPHLPRE